MRTSTMIRSLIRSFLLLAIFNAQGASARTWKVPLEAPTIKAGMDSAQVGDVV